MEKTLAKTGRWMLVEDKLDILGGLLFIQTP